MKIRVSGLPTLKTTSLNRRWITSYHNLGNNKECGGANQEPIILKQKSFSFWNKARPEWGINARFTEVGSRILSSVQGYQDKIESEFAANLVHQTKLSLFKSLVFTAGASAVLHLVRTYVRLPAALFAFNLSNRFVKGCVKILPNSVECDKVLSVLPEVNLPVRASGDVILNFGSDFLAHMRTIPHEDLVKGAYQLYSVSLAPFIEENARRVLGWKFTVAICFGETYEQCPWEMFSAEWFQFLAFKFVVHGTFHISHLFGRTLPVFLHTFWNGMCVAKDRMAAKQPRPQKRVFKCTHCNKEGHTEERCWDKLGRPKQVDGPNGAPKSGFVRKGKKGGPRGQKNAKHVNGALRDLAQENAGMKDAMKDLVEDIIDNLEKPILDIPDVEEGEKKPKLPRTPAAPEPQEDDISVAELNTHFSNMINKHGRKGYKLSFDEGQKRVGLLKRPMNCTWNKFLSLWRRPVCAMDRWCSKYFDVFRLFNKLVIFDVYEKIDSDKYTVMLKHKMRATEYCSRADVHAVIDFKHFEKIVDCQHFIYREFDVATKMLRTAQPNLFELHQFMDVETAEAELTMKESKLELELFIQLTHIGLLDSTMTPEDAHRAIVRNAKRLCTVNYNRYRHLVSNHLQVMSLHYAKAYFNHQLLEVVSTLDFHRASPQTRDSLRLVIAHGKLESFLHLFKRKTGLSLKMLGTSTFVLFVVWKWFLRVLMLRGIAYLISTQETLLPCLMACVHVWGK